MENDWLKRLKEYDINLFNPKINLNDEDLKDIKTRIKKDEETISFYQTELLNLRRIIDFDTLKKKGFSEESLKSFFKEDNCVIEEANNYLKEQKNSQTNYMFGYPANMMDESGVVSYLRWIESQLYYINSCGTPYSHGNYRMSNPSTELNIISKIMENLKLNAEEYWGYITTGGTEGNIWGIREGFNKFSDGKLYFSEESHYSVSKAASMFGKNRYKIISSINGSINKEELLNSIVLDSNSKDYGAILLFNYGSTALGSIDDVKWIKEKLLEKNIPHYIHLDAALYGGIPTNQLNAPSNNLQEILKLGIDSISISLHKYIGIPKTNGILLAKSQINNNFIEYIGQNDVTLCGSRDYLPYTTLQKIKELYDRSNENDYYDNVKYFEKLLNDNNISYEKGDKNGNIFIITKPSDEICYKYQLATFNYKNNKKAHIIIFPFHKKEIMNELVKEIASETHDKFKNDTKGGR